MEWKVKQFLSPSPLPPLTLRASPSDATKTMLQFFKYGVTDYSVTGSKSKAILAAQTSKSTDMLHLQTPTITPPKSSFNFKPSTSILD
ncbi:unnamed protein product [Miscanthus lutarioriparius]|uniref:Uncharacterized protein n=1 Tax=Miscanthus lutarioriparius TaxID=422564 RepID=A0A811QNE3_9POAL|nr:unnamed protein product [Miscanthus lutarioriparius]